MSLPKGYTPVEYIKTTGTQYIDTGFVPNQNTRVKMKVLNGSEASTWLFGVWALQDVDQFAASCSTKHSFRYGSKMVSLPDLPVGIIVDVELNKNAYHMNGVSGTMEEQTFTATANMYLFRLNANGKPGSGSLTGRCYECQVYDDGTLIRDFVPCVNPGGEAGLYDRVGGVFYGNSGTGSFVAGYYFFPELVYDRTYADVMRWLELRNKGYANMTAAERAEWDAGNMKGAYNISDLNRVGEALNYLRDRLAAANYLPSSIFSAETYWTTADIPTASDLRNYLRYVSTIREAMARYKTTPAVPEYTGGLDYQEANNIEKILVDVDQLITNMLAARYCCGELYGGEV